MSRPIFVIKRRVAPIEVGNKTMAEVIADLEAAGPDGVAAVLDRVLKNERLVPCDERGNRS